MCACVSAFKCECIWLYFSFFHRKNKTRSRKWYVHDTVMAHSDLLLCVRIHASCDACIKALDDETKTKMKAKQRKRKIVCRNVLNLMHRQRESYCSRFAPYFMLPRSHELMKFDFDRMNIFTCTHTHTETHTHIQRQLKSAKFQLKFIGRVRLRVKWQK